MNQAKKINQFKKAVKSSLKKSLPKFVKFSNLEEDMTIYLTIPLSKRMGDDYHDISRKIEKWAKSFGYTEYGGGTGGEVYDIHLGPDDAILKDKVSRIKKAIKESLKNMDSSLYCIEQFDDIIQSMKNLHLIDSDVDTEIHLQMPK